MMVGIFCVGRVGGGVITGVRGERWRQKAVKKFLAAGERRLELARETEWAGELMVLFSGRLAEMCTAWWRCIQLGRGVFTFAEVIQLYKVLSALGGGVSPLGTCFSLVEIFQLGGGDLALPRCFSLVEVFQLGGVF